MTVDIKDDILPDIYTELESLVTIQKEQAVEIEQIGFYLQDIAKSLQIISTFYKRQL